MKARKNGKVVRTAKNVIRDGKMIHVEVIKKYYDIVVQFDEILEACEIHDDEDHGKPWDECDGFDHRKVRADRDEFDNQDTSERAGYTYCQGERDYFVIIPEWDDTEEYEFYRARGCSRQTAREKVAQMNRARLEQLTSWYSDGWNYYGVTCSFNGYESGGLWGIDDHHYADKDVRQEQAEEVADQMEAEGYVVEGRPAKHKLHRGMDKEAFAHHLKRNLRLDCWE